MSIYKDILNILNMVKYRNSFAGDYPFEKEEYAKMITEYIKNDRKRIRNGAKGNKN